MEVLLFVPVLIGLVALVGAIALLKWYFECKRSEAFESLASRLGLLYYEEDRSIPGRYEFLDKLRQGENRYAFNILEGEYQDHPVKVFDYHYETYTHNRKGRRQTHHHYFSFFILHQQRRFPELRIYPEGILSKLGQMIGFDDIDLESAEFSRAFVVKSTDKKFAFDVCHTRMMEYLLKHRDLSIEIEEDSVALSFDRRLKPEEIEPRLRQLVEIRSLFPEYLYRG